MQITRRLGMARLPRSVTVRRERSRLEHRQRIERRSRALLDAQRRGHEQELVAIYPSRFFDGSLEIEVVEDADAHGHERKLVESHALRQAGRRDIVRPIGADE